MSVVTVKSTAISNRDASPVVLTDDTIAAGRIKEAYGFVSATNGDSIGSKYILMTVPSQARLSSLILQCAALGTSATIDVGAYNNEASGGAVISANIFGAAIDAHLALGVTEVLNQSGNVTLDLQEKPLWQMIGMSADPFSTIDIVITVHAAIAATGLISLKARFI